MKARTLLLAFASIFLLLVLNQGCTTYYYVTDRNSGATYYTTEIVQTADSIRLLDDKTSELVSVWNYEVKRVDKSEYFYLLNQPASKITSTAGQHSKDENDSELSIKVRD